MPRMRTLKETYNYIKQQDPNSAITQNALRNLVRNGKLPCIHIGAKYLLDLDVLDEFLRGAKP